MEEEQERCSATEQWLDRHAAAVGAVGTLFFVGLMLLSTGYGQAVLHGPKNWNLICSVLQTIVSLASPWLVYWQVKKSQEQSKAEQHNAVRPDLTPLQLACHPHRAIAPNEPPPAPATPAPAAATPAPSATAPPPAETAAFDLTWSFRNDGVGPAKRLTGHYQPTRGAQISLLPAVQTLPEGETCPCKVAGILRPAAGHVALTCQDRLGQTYNYRFEIREENGLLRVADEKGVPLLEHRFTS